MKKFLLALLLTVATLCAEVVQFKDVVYYARKKPTDNPKKQDGVLAIDRTGGGITFLKDKKILASISASEIGRMTFSTKDGKILTLQFKTPTGMGEFVQFDLKTGKRENVINTLEAMTGVKVERIK